MSFVGSSKAAFSDPFHQFLVSQLDQADHQKNSDYRQIFKSVIAASNQHVKVDENIFPITNNRYLEDLEKYTHIFLKTHKLSPDESKKYMEALNTLPLISPADTVQALKREIVLDTD